MLGKNNTLHCFVSNLLPFTSSQNSSGQKHVLLENRAFVVTAVIQNRWLLCIRHQDTWDGVSRISSSYQRALE